MSTPMFQRMPSQVRPKLDRILPPEIAWDAATIQKKQLKVGFNEALLREARDKKELLNQEIPLEGTNVDNSGFPCLQREAAALRAQRLEANTGFVIATGLDDVLDTETAKENIFWRLCVEMGTPLVQKSGSIRFGRVENLGRSTNERPRYHESGTGGSIHTDSPIMAEVADFVGLMCVRPALTGGESKFVSVARVHNILLEHAGDLLDVLYTPFYFDRRLNPEDVCPENPATLYEPIFSYDPSLGDRGLRLRWQPEYVWQAPQLPGIPPLTEKQVLALHLLEGLLEDRTGSLTVEISMGAGDLQLVNNHVVAHGRSAFQDHVLIDDVTKPDPVRRRLMRRVWMHRRQ